MTIICSLSEDVTDLLEGFFRLCVVGICLKSALIVIFSLLDVHCTTALLQFTKLVEAVCILRIVRQTDLKVLLCFQRLLIVIVSRCEVEVALR